MLRLESEGGLYHVINRGNYRADIFRSEKTKEAFLKKETKKGQTLGFGVDRVGEGSHLLGWPGCCD